MPGDAGKILNAIGDELVPLWWFLVLVGGWIYFLLLTTLPYWLLEPEPPKRVDNQE
jgi:hypothetical protein